MPIPKQAMLVLKSIPYPIAAISKEKLENDLP